MADAVSRLAQQRDARTHHPLATSTQKGVTGSNDDVSALQLETPESASTNGCGDRQ